VEIVLIVLFIIAAIVAVVVFSPIIILVDSRNSQVRVRWLSALEFQMPLPGTAGQKCLTIFRRSVPIHQRQPGTEARGEKKQKPAKPAAEIQRARAKRRAVGRFVMRCLADSSIRRALARQVSMLLRRTFHSANLTRAQIDLSMPDPAFNGMLAGVLAAANVPNRSGMRVNFRDENSLSVELHFHLHRLFKALLFFLAGLPHRALFRQWRTFAAAQRH
jgi:hypothetical protein